MNRKSSVSRRIPVASKPIAKAIATEKTLPVPSKPKTPEKAPKVKLFYMNSVAQNLVVAPNAQANAPAERRVQPGSAKTPRIGTPKPSDNVSQQQKNSGTVQRRNSKPPVQVRNRTSSLETIDTQNTPDANVEVKGQPPTSRPSMRKPPPVQAKIPKNPPASKKQSKKIEPGPKIDDMFRKQFEVSIAIIEQDLSLSGVNFSFVPPSKLQDDLLSDQIGPLWTSHIRQNKKPSNGLLKQSSSEIPQPDILDGLKKSSQKSDRIISKEATIQKLSKSKPYYRLDYQMSSLGEVIEQKAEDSALEQSIVCSQKFSVASSKIIYEGPTLHKQSFLPKSKPVVTASGVNNEDRSLSFSQTQLLSTRATIKDGKKLSTLISTPLKTMRDELTETVVAETRPKTSEKKLQHIDSLSRSMMASNNRGEFQKSRTSNLLDLRLTQTNSTTTNRRFSIKNHETPKSSSRRDNSCSLAEPEARSETPVLVRRKTPSRKLESSADSKIFKDLIYNLSQWRKSLENEFDTNHDLQTPSFVNPLMTSFKKSSKNIPTTQTDPKPVIPSDTIDLHISKDAKTLQELSSRDALKLSNAFIKIIPPSARDNELFLSGTRLSSPMVNSLVCTSTRHHENVSDRNFERRSKSPSMKNILTPKVVPFTRSSVATSNERNSSRTTKNLKSMGIINKNDSLVDWINMGSASLPGLLGCVVSGPFSQGPVFYIGHNTHSGLFRKYNEDKIALHTPASKSDTRPRNKSSALNPMFLCSVFDGHGGEHCSEFLASNLHERILEEVGLDSENIETNLSRLYKNLDSQYFKVASKNYIRFTGSCAITVAITPSSIYTINVGDSRAVMSMKNGTALAELSIDHKPSNADELKRILSIGGKIYRSVWNPVQRKTWDEFAKSMDDFKRLDGETKANTFYQYGPWRLSPGSLSVSRSIGDFESKMSNYGAISGCLTCDPQVIETKTVDADFLVVGCEFTR
jgi:serine/threonine protein phosphatase PrpC